MNDGIWRKRTHGPQAVSLSFSITSFHGAQCGVRLICPESLGRNEVHSPSERGQSQNPDRVTGRDRLDRSGGCAKTFMIRD